MASPDHRGTPAVSLSVVIPTHNNLPVLKQCVQAWRDCGSADAVEMIVVEDGCHDGTAAFLSEMSLSNWGRNRLRWVHEENVHELRCTNRGFAEAKGSLLAAWQDDMLLRARWLVPELIATFAAYPEIGLLSLSRGLNSHPVEEPITEWEHLNEWRRLESTIGRGPGNWLRLQEVDTVIRPWVVRRESLDKVGDLDEAFCPTEWDEADLCYRIRQAGWRIATHGYERAGAYQHLGSTTLSRTFSAEYKKRVLRNGLIFHGRWGATIRREDTRVRRTWMRRMGGTGWRRTLLGMVRTALSGRQRGR